MAKTGIPLDKTGQPAYHVVTQSEVAIQNPLNQMKIYIQQDNQTVGPFTKEELQDRIYSGELARTVSASLEGSSDWTPLESLLTKNSTSSLPAPPTLAIPLDKLRDPTEKTALVLLYIASIPMWLLLLLWTIGSMGAILIIFGLMELFYLIGQMWFAAHVKTNAVRVSGTQLPEVHRIVRASCQKLGMEPPDVYVMQQNVWNSFATKIFKRRMVILLSGAVDSILLKGDMDQLAWLVGHELGHHWAGHLDFSRKLAKAGGWLIWVNLWYSRRAEFTCDRVGMYCAGNLKSSQRAVINATVGAQLADKVDIGEAMSQWHQHRSEFFVKYRTLYSTHPHLLARLDNLNNVAAELGISR